MYLDYSDISSETVTDANALNNAIRNIIFTKKGSVPGKPRFGSDIHRILFNQIDHITIAILQDSINDALNEFEPRIFVKKVDVKEIPEYNRLVAEITYVYRDKGIETQETINIALKE